MSRLSENRPKRSNNDGGSPNGSGDGDSPNEEKFQVKPFAQTAFTKHLVKTSQLIKFCI